MLDHGRSVGEAIRRSGGSVCSYGCRQMCRHVCRHLIDMCQDRHVIDMCQTLRRVPRRRAKPKCPVRVHACASACLSFTRCEWYCTDTYADMCTDMCIDKYMDICIGKCFNFACFQRFHDRLRRLFPSDQVSLHMHTRVRVSART